MYQQINPTEVFRERELALLMEAKKRRLVGRRVSARREPKARSAIATAVVGFLGALVVASLMLAASSSPAHAASTTPIVVNSTLDWDDLNTADGVCDVTASLEDTCTLRAAIQQANATSGANEIEFAIPKAFRDPNTGVATISPLSSLPAITEQVTINGYTQPGAHPNTKTVGDDASLKLELDGTNVPDTVGLEISNSSNSVIRGLVIDGFQIGILVFGRSAVGNRIEGNFIGTDPTGTLEGGSQLLGVVISDGEKTVVGGSTLDNRNIISDQSDNGVLINGSDANANAVQGNYVGTDKSGTKDLGIQVNGIRIEIGASGTTVGGTTAASRNVISGNQRDGLNIFSSKGTKVLGNRIGTTASGKGALPNHANGVTIDGSSNNVIGDGTSGGSNTIAFNGGVGVFIEEESLGNKVSRNSVFSNGGMGIDLSLTFGSDGPTANDPDDPATPEPDPDSDSGPNDLQNKPILSSAKASSTKTTIRGKLNSTPNKTFTVRFFSNPPGGEEGKNFLGQKKVSADSSGNVTFTKALPKVAVGKTITATATKNSTGDTSEFSAPRKVVAA